MSDVINITIADLGEKGVGVPDSGTAGQVLSKKSGTSFDTEWVTVSGSVTDEEKAIWNAKADTADIPTTLAELTDDSTHRLVTDTEKAAWNAGGGGGLALGETSTTAYRGDRGKTAYDHSQVTGNPHGTTKTDLGLGNVPNLAFSGSNTGDETAATIKTKLGITTLSGVNTGDQTFMRPVTIGVTSTDIITTGEKLASIVCPISGTITKWTLISDVATLAILSIWKANATRPTVANIITGSAKPTLSSALYATSSTLTGWTTSVVAGDVFVISVDSNSAAKFLSVTLEIN